MTQLLKRYNDSYQQKVASVFEKASVEKSLAVSDGTQYILGRKAIVAIALSGGLRTAEIRDLNLDVIKKSDIYKIHLQRKKQHGEKSNSMFIVPSSLATHVTNYLMALTACLRDVVGPLTKGTSAKDTSRVPIFANQPVGTNMLYGIGKDVATILQLDNPETYTGHCFRRTVATMAADGGATTHQLQRAFGWKSVNTVQKYVEEKQSGAQVMA